jgi:drug/metabolite transporter (DMT)-like permease
MLGFCILAPMGDVVAKLLGATIPLGQVVLIRFAFQAVVLALLVWVTGRAWHMRGWVLGMTVLRTLLHIIGIAAMFTSLKFLPLADAVAIVFVMPFFMLFLGKYFLNEEVGKRRLIACTVGFIGTLLVVQPSFVTVGWFAFLPVFVAANFSAFMLVTRKIAKETDPIGLQAVSGVMAVVFMLPLIWWGNNSNIAFLATVSPTPGDWWLLFAIGFFGTTAHLFMSWSLRFAPSATLAPMQYLEIPVATLLGFVIFHDLPNTLASLGILITMAAGLFVILRERTIAQRLALTAPPQPAE